VIPPRVSHQLRNLLTCNLLNCAFTLVLGILFAGASAHSQTLEVLYKFTGGADGSQPDSPLVRDSQGNLYGTTVTGGANQLGAVFKLSPDGTETVLYSFQGGVDGVWPVGLTLASDGNFYGVTRYGGTPPYEGYGTVFKLTPNGTETVLYAFNGGADGNTPLAGVVRDAQGNLYGTTFYGGDEQCGSCGVVFKVAPDGSETVLHTFTGAPDDGAWSTAGLALDSSGNLYGTTTYGGAHNWGTIFKVAPDSTETVLYNFANAADGANPATTPIFDPQGNLFGTTVPMLFPQNAYGTVYKLVPTSGTLSTLYTFLKPSNGAYPYGPLALDQHSNLFGTTFDSVNEKSYHGTVFELTAKGRLKTLRRFIPAVGDYPNQGVLLDPQGNLYGTTSAAGAYRYGYGTVFKLTP